MIDWSRELVHEILKERCVIFLGAGVSASAKDEQGSSPPTWDEFLFNAVTLVLNQQERDAIKELMLERKPLIALQAIKDRSDPAAYRALLDQTFNHRGYKPSDVHKCIYELDARIVITTNFDKIYETYCHSFVDGNYAYKTIHYRSDDLGDEIRSDTRLIIKAHGSIDAISELIFTRAEYHEAKRKYVGFYDILKAIFLTNTILFIGCSLDDPDISLLLEEVRIAGRHQKPHYALVLKGNKNSVLINDWKTTYNIRVLEYEPDHQALAVELGRLLSSVQEERAALNSPMA